MTDIMVRKEMLTWAREFRGLTLEAAAERLSFDVEELRSIELGAAPINLTQFRRYSERLRIPLATLLRQTPPPLPPTPLDYRTFAGRPASLGFETRLAISYAYTIEQNVLELVEAHAAPDAPDLPLLSLDMDPAAAGEMERRRLGVTADMQLRWNWGDAFRTWRTVIEREGVYVLQQKFDLEDCKGFTIFRDSSSPIIMLNKSELYDPAKTYSLIHEYAHLLLRQPGLSDLQDVHPVEAFCNRFAAGFLMPTAALREVLPYWPNEPVDWSFYDLSQWARRLKVSQQALGLRLEQLRKAPIGYYDRLTAQQEQTASYASREGGGGNYVSTQVSEVGYRFTRAVLNAADADRITATEASEMLALSPRHFGLLMDRLDAQFANAGPSGIHY